MTGDNEHRTYTDAEMTEIAADLVSKGSYSWSGPSYNPLRENRPELTALPLFVRVTDNEEVRARFRLVPVYDEPGGVPPTVQKMTCNEVPAWMKRLRQVPFGVHVDPYRSLAKPVSLMFEDRCSRGTLSADRRYLVDKKSDLKVRLDQLEPGNFWSSARVSRYLSKLQVTYNEDRGAYDIRPTDENIQDIEDLKAKGREARRDRPSVVTYDAEERAAQHLPMLWVVYDESRDIYRFDMRPLTEKGHRAHSGHLFNARADHLARVLWMLNEDTVPMDLLRAALARLSD